MKETLEREVKLTPGAGFALPELGGERVGSRVFVSTYHDTEDLVLARHGITLRHRMEDGAGLWQLKLPSDSDRLELEQPGAPARAPRELTALLLALTRGRELVRVARLRTRREVVQVDGAEVVDDSVAVLDGQRVTHRFRELEIELVEGGAETLHRIQKALQDAGATSSDGRPKLFQALALQPAPPPQRVRRGASADVALGMAFAEQARRILVNDPGTRLGSDPEHLHRMRVATRRLRAFLRAARPLLEDAWSEPLRAELGWLGRSLGPVRDLDVLVGYLSGEVAAVGADPAGTSLIDGLERERAEARRAMVEELSSDRYIALLGRLDDAGHPRVSGRSIRFAELWKAEWKRARKRLARLGDESPDDELHEARIRLKRARYVAELGRHELGKDADRFATAASRLQDVLGEHQDAAVAEEQIQRWAAAGAGSGALAERLVQRQRQRRARSRAALPDAWEAVRNAAKPLS